MPSILHLHILPLKNTTHKRKKKGQGEQKRSNSVLTLINVVHIYFWDEEAGECPPASSSQKPLGCSCNWASIKWSVLPEIVPLVRLGKTLLSSWDMQGRRRERPKQRKTLHSEVACVQALSCSVNAAQDNILVLVFLSSLAGMGNTLLSARGRRGFHLQWFSGIAWASSVILHACGSAVFGERGGRAGVSAALVSSDS